MKPDRRRSKRTAVDISATISEYDYKANIVDISAHGVGFMSKFPLEKGEKITLTFYINGEITVNAKIVRIENFGSSAYLYGAEFTKTSHKLIKTLEKITR